MIVAYGIGRNKNSTLIVTMGYGIDISIIPIPIIPVIPGYFGSIPTTLPKLIEFVPKIIKEIEDDEEVLLILSLFK